MSKTSSANQDAQQTTQVQGAASFSKFMVVLQIIADEPGALDIARLTKLAPFPRGTVYRIVSALIAEGLVTQHRENGTYRLGQRLIRLASKSWETSDLRTLARESLTALRDATDEIVHLAVPSGNSMVYIDKLESSNTVRMQTSIGAQVELHTTSVGKAWLSGLPDARLHTILASLDLRRHTKNTFTSPEALFEELVKTRDRGYAYDFEENEPDIRCFGSPVFNRQNEPIGAISISIPAYRYDDTRHKRYATLVRQTAQAITGALSTIV